MARMSVVALARLDRDRKALKLRAQGLPWEDIARECGFTGKNPRHAALAAVQRLNARETHEDVVLSRTIHRERIEMLMRSLWLAAINPGMAQKAAREAQQPQPPDQARAIALLRGLLDDLAAFEGTKLPVRAEITGPAGGPIEGRVDVLHWRPDEQWMRDYARVLREAGLLDDTIDGEVRLLTEGDPEAPAE